MMRSLYSGISGLRNHQTRMDVIANNISNVNTTGFTASRVVFQDVFSQTSQYAASSTSARGGINPIQIGLGMSLATIDMLHTSATNLSRTDRPLDFAISGEGFFIVNINGGDGANDNFGGNANVVPNPLEPELRYTRTGNFYWDNEGFLVNGDGNFVMGVQVYEGTPVDDAALAYTGGDIRDTYVDPLDDLTDPSALTKINATGFTNISIDPNGIVSGTNENGIREAIGYLVTSTFMNNNGLEKVGNSLYQQSNNSGPATFTVASANGSGEFASGYLEMSNVDLASEFTDMIVTQRGFQANSRIITTSDSMLEELVNLKR